MLAIDDHDDGLAPTRLHLHSFNTQGLFQPGQESKRDRGVDIVGRDHEGVWRDAHVAGMAQRWTAAPFQKKASGDVMWNKTQRAQCRSILGPFSRTEVVYNRVRSTDLTCH